MSYRYISWNKIAAETNEPSQVARYLLYLSSAFSTYYRANKVADPVIL